MKQIKIRVIPNSKTNKIIKDDMLTVRIKEPPVKGKANKAVINLLSKHFKTKVKIVSGLKSRTKIVELD